MSDAADGMRAEAYTVFGSTFLGNSAILLLLSLICAAVMWTNIKLTAALGNLPTSQEEGDV